MVEVFEGPEDLGHTDEEFGLLRSWLLELTQGVEGELVVAPLDFQQALISATRELDEAVQIVTTCWVCKGLDHCPWRVFSCLRCIPDVIFLAGKRGLALA